MLRQQIEPLPQYRIPIPIVVKTPVFRQPPPYTAPPKDQEPAASLASEPTRAADVLSENS